MRASTSVPAAAGIVKVQKDKDNGNLKLEIKVDHLANPASLMPPASDYIVWVLPRGGAAAVKQGAIRVDKDLKGELKVVTVSTDFDVFITAEKSEIVSAPSDFKVLTTHVSLP
ncbi:MAG: hypothetical protein ABI833_11555 [Acidobacteriota bacterium]